MTGAAGVVPALTVLPVWCLSIAGGICRVGVNPPLELSLGQGTCTCALSAGSPKVPVLLQVPFASAAGVTVISTHPYCTWGEAGSVGRSGVRGELRCPSCPFLCPCRYRRGIAPGRKAALWWLGDGLVQSFAPRGLPSAGGTAGHSPRVSEITGLGAPLPGNCWLLRWGIKIKDLWLQGRVSQPSGVLLPRRVFGRLHTPLPPRLCFVTGGISRRGCHSRGVAVAGGAAACGCAGAGFWWGWGLGEGSASAGSDRSAIKPAPPRAELQPLGSAPSAGRDGDVAQPPGGLRHGSQHHRGTGGSRRNALCSPRIAPSNSPGFPRGRSAPPGGGWQRRR